MPVLNVSQSNLGSVLFGQPSMEAVDYFTSVKNQILNKSSGFKDEFLQVGKQVFDSVYSARALELAKAAINKAGSLFTPNLIKELKTLEELQTAKPMMQRYIMANPLVREMYHDLRCYGYGDSYFDFEPDKIGEDHYDFRRVFNGVLRVNEDTGEWFKTIYREGLRNGDNHLDPSDQIDILNTHRNIENFMLLAAKDPTSDWNADL
jgi:hypothetical protein